MEGEEARAALQKDYPEWQIFRRRGLVHAWLPGPVNPLEKLEDSSVAGLRAQLERYGPLPGDESQPVAAWPGWVWWRGVNGLLYARKPRTSPPRVARAHNFTALLAAIRKMERRET